MKYKLYFWILIILLSFLLLHNLYTQTFPSFGFKTGLVSAYYASNSTPSNYHYTSTSSLGFSIGVFAEFFKVKKFSTIIELNYEEKGGNDKVYSPVIINNYSSIYLLSIPVLAKLTFTFLRFNPYLAVGPRTDIFISRGNSEFEQYLYKNINSVEFGILLAVGTEIKISQEISLLFETSYSPDFTTSEIPPGVSGGKTTIRNFAFEFRTGLKFNH